MPGATLTERPGLLYGVAPWVTPPVESQVTDVPLVSAVVTVNGIPAVPEPAFTMVAVCAAGTV